MFDNLKIKFNEFKSSISRKLNVLENEKMIHNKEDNFIKKDVNIFEKAKLFILNKEVIINEKELEYLLEKFKLELLESDVAYDVSEYIINELKSNLIGSSKKINENIEEIVLKSIKKSINDILSNNYFDFDKFIKEHKNDFIHILFIGVNGTGKTTTIAKLSKYLSKNMNLSVAIAAGDTYRAGAVEQLEIHSKRLNIKIIEDRNRKDPTSVIYDGISYCKSEKINVLLSDTSGRMHTNKNLMSQLEKIYRITKPNLVFYVEDSTSGNDAIERIKYFGDIVPIDGIILTKLDADTRGGSAISMSYISKKPIVFIGTGQKYSDIHKFNSDWFVNELFT